MKCTFFARNRFVGILAACRKREFVFQLKDVESAYCELYLLSIIIM